MLKISPQIAEALRFNKPIVALESTVFSPLGLPYPESLQTYEKVTEEITSRGAVPAVTAILDGEAHLGLEPPQSDRLFEEVFTQAEPPQSQKVSSACLRKVSLADLPVAMAQGWRLGVTTVSASLALAHRGGVKVFATGGIGGVHRENHWDISADLQALGSFPMATVCSGAKAFLDLPATLERLESLCVSVVGYQTDNFPAFWCAESSLSVRHKVEKPAQAATILAQISLNCANPNYDNPNYDSPDYTASNDASPNLASPSQNTYSRTSLSTPGVLFAVPPPAAVALEWSVVSESVEEALLAVKNQGVKGSAVTPFILEKIRALEGTLAANTALVANNAAVAADIAVALG